MSAVPSSPATAMQAESHELEYRKPTSVKGSEASDFVVGEGRHSHWTAPLNDEGREIAITRARLLMEFFMVEAGVAERRYAESSHLVDKADADAARGRAHQARQLMEALIRGRSPEQILRMARDQAGRMAREPGATRD